jgi:hypothetical protein
MKRCKLFKHLQIGEKFYLNGMECTKKSTRTAFVDGNTLVRWFYFGANEAVTTVSVKANKE